MTDLVSHLRESATDLCSPGGCCYAESMVKAADEIERLRAVEKAARELWNAVQKTGDHTQWFMPLSNVRLALNAIDEQGTSVAKETNT